MSEIKRLRKMADKIYAKMENMQRLTDSELKGKTDEFKLRLKTAKPWTRLCLMRMQQWERRLTEALV